MAMTSHITTSHHRACARRLLALTTVALLMAGCTKPAGVVFEPLPAPIVWPSPPDAPRIAYVGQISTTADLKAAKPFGESLREFFAGKNPVMGVVNPFAVETDNQQRLFVADSGGRMIHVFDLDTRIYEQWTPAAPQRFISPVGLARAADGRLFVADSAAGIVWVFDAAGHDLDMWGRDELVRPCGMAYDDAGQRLFVADAGAHQVVIFDAAGQPTARLGSRGSGVGQFNFPTDVTIDHHRRLYVSDSINCRVQQFGPDLMPLLQVGSRGDFPGYFSRPKGIAVDSEDHLYVIDAEFEAVQVYSSAGELLMAFGREGNGPGEFWLPAGICIDARDRLWIADTYNRRVQVFDYLPLRTAAAPDAKSEATP